MKFQVIFKNKETQQEEVGELFLQLDEIACFYKDSYGTFVSTASGRSYKVKNTLQELEGLFL
jgi:hypothetical protein